MKLEKNVFEAIKSSLPEATAGVLKEFFNEHDIIVKNLKTSEDELVNAEKRTLELTREIETLKSYKRRLEEIEKGEASLKESLVELRIKEGIFNVEQKYSASAVSDYKETFNKVFDSVFRNTEIRKSVTKNHVVKMPEMTSGFTDNNGNQIMQDGGEMLQESTDIETTEDK